jgi:hypothetical protein
MERFTLQQSELKANSLVCTDTENLIICTFEKHRFNDTQEYKFLTDPKTKDPIQLAKTAREMSDWLRVNHYSDIF